MPLAVLPAAGLLGLLGLLAKTQSWACAGTLLDNCSISGSLKAEPASAAHAGQNVVRLVWGVTLASYGPDDAAGDTRLVPSLPNVQAGGTGSMQAWVRGLGFMV